MSCDVELQELMKQVDKMVEENKMEWQEKIKNTENKFNNILQENFNLKSIIDDRNTEITNLKNRVNHKDNVGIFDYDQEVLQLRLELSQIKKSYEKYYHKYSKKIKEFEKEKEDMCKEKIDLLKEINEMRNLRKEYNDEKIQLQDQIRDLESKKNNSFLDCESLNEQLNLLKCDFNSKLNGYVDSEQRYSHHLKELEGQLNDSRMKLQRETEECKSKICDMVQHLKKCQEEKQQLIIDNESAKRMIIRLENELSRYSSDNKVKEKTICKMEQVLKASEKTINEKHEVIRALQVNSTSKDYATLVSKLENELHETKSHLKLCKKAEKSFQVDIQTLQKKFKEAQEFVENQKNWKKQLEICSEQILKMDNEKASLLHTINTFESAAETKDSEIMSVKAQLENLKIENENLIHQLNEERKNNDKNVRSESLRNSEDGNGDSRLNHSTETIIKERNYLLNFCEEKDLIIHRLQMENRILQQFISKLNDGLSGDMPLFNGDFVMDNCTTVSDVFQPLKETFIELDASPSPDKVVDNPNHTFMSSSQPLSQKPNEFFNTSTDSFSNMNFYHENLRTHVNKSSDQFLTGLILTDSGEGKGIDSDCYMKLYPTLAAAKYFTEEREKTKKIEKMIDFHMDQLKKETAIKRSFSNQ